MSDVARTADQGWRERLGDFMESSRVRNFVLAVIFFNAVVLGLETSGRLMAHIGPVLETIDRICLAVFVVELVLKLVARGPAFFTRAWNIFDFVIVGIALMPTGDGLAVLRALRVLRVLRALSMAPTLRRVVQGLIGALPGMGSVILLMSMIFYIGAVMATKLFGATHPQWFGTVGESAYSLFQIMTLESWSMGIVRPVMEEHPQAWAFFVPFILVTTFAVVNLLVGLVVNSMQEASSEDSDAATDSYRHEVLLALERIERRLDRLEEAERRDRSGAGPQGQRPD